MKQFYRRHASVIRTLAVILVAGGAVFALTQMDHAQTTPTTSAPASGRSPTIGNQFTTTTGGALQARRPGLQVQQGIAETTGSSQFLVGDATHPDDFVTTQIKSLILQIFDTISQIFSGLNVLAGGNPLSGLLGGSGGTSGLGSLFGNLTSGTGSVPIS